MFYFVVRYLRWLAQVPGFPQVFDAFLLASTCILRRSRFVAMEALEVEALRLRDVRVKNHRFGGIEFIEGEGRELGHLHGHGLLDVFVPLETAQALIATGRVRSHHVFPNSRWISFQIESNADIPFALELLTMARTSVPSESDVKAQILTASRGELHSTTDRAVA
ncbi:MAG: hypothetical protein JWM68_5520 [Verrucomicrobiales bacterium]|nr:hypothetical protein [Verrucomicrobiales bacterium]